METTFIGREYELNKFRNLYNTDKSDLVVVLGRRRVGKTHMIKEAFKDRFDFHFTGIQKSDKETTFLAFRDKLLSYQKYPNPIVTPDNWMEAFNLLRNYLRTLPKKRKKTVFLDEFPWMDVHMSGFIPAFEYFWNDWAVDQNIVIVICGSATSWMIKNIRDNRGGLHNRVSQYIHLAPFTLAETELFLKSCKVTLNRMQIAHLYMALGGIPYYLENIEPGESAAQYIDRILFDPSGKLHIEFNNLYRSLFDYYENYEAVVKALATSPSGLTRDALADITTIPKGGGLSKVLTHLEECDFIVSSNPYGRVKKQAIYQLVDEYSLFYFRFVPQKKNAGSYLSIQNTPKHNTWLGHAYEKLAYKHIHAIKRSLGIAGVHTEIFSYYHKGSNEIPGFQIDLLIDRNDNIIHICEIKYSATNFQLSKAEAEKLQQRIVYFAALTKTKKQITPILITTHSLKKNSYSIGLIDTSIQLDNLFSK
jgi:AAA+ ATPase superfamily predicted ATPase